MSSKNVHRYNKGNSRKNFHTSKKKQSKKKKAFYYPKNKIYSEEIESSPVKCEKEKENSQTENIIAD